ncbi:MATE efflux family protein [Clostridium thermobutyricum]|uniref:Multidrug export protein MepA n=1 Tax=Clostridium thermobutyricum TaxID=29372 RepID=N9XL41_9CLOT|nr:MATE family efflux transporter [Clostridium thermobutyricum]ENZ00413.1 MATE efflux family protein [Clostridium thermobutyricum]
MTKENKLGTEKVSKLLISFSVPAIIGMLVNTLYNIIDRMYIGNIEGVGKLAITGVGITMPIMTIILAFGMLVGIGTASRISIFLGKGDKETAEKHIGNAFVLIIIFSILITIIGLAFLDKILVVFGASSSTEIYARQYMQIIFAGTIVSMLSFGLNHSIRSDGSPKIAMLSMLIGAIINIILDPILIFIFNLGVRGAAIATVISQFVATIWILYYFTKGQSSIKLKKENFKLKKYIVLSIFSIGISPCSMQIAACIVQVIANNSLKHYGGDLAIGAMTIVQSIGMIFLTPIFGLNQGSQPIIGYNFGAKKYKRVKTTVFYGAITATIIVTIGWLVVQLAPQLLIKIFNNDPELLEIAKNGLRIYLLFIPVIGLQIISSNYFQSVGKAKISMFLSLLRQVILLIPFMIILPRIFGLNGIWMAGAISDLLSAIITCCIFYNSLKKLNKENDNIQKEIEVNV